VISALRERLIAALVAAAGANRRVWRLGHIDAPLDFVPRERCSWEHRFDDPEHDYRTLYCAEQPITCLREVLADLRPNLKARAEFAQFQRDLNVKPEEIRHPARDVSAGWRARHALAPALVGRVAPLADLRQRRLLEQLADAHADLLVQHQMEQLDLSQITSKNRIVTQTVGRDLHDQGAAGLLFRSNLDGEPCIVLFEGRARLHPDGRAIPMTENHPALLHVCSDYNLVLRPATPLPGQGGRWMP
jgi:hypothetical protein